VRTAKSDRPWGYLLFAILWAAVDQWIKFRVRGSIPLHGSAPFLPGVLDLTYVQNTGAAFSSFSSHTLFLALVSALAAVVLCYLLFSDILPARGGRLALALLLGGAIGNLIDRVFFRFVTDMFRLSFVDFAVFNFADIGVTCGGALFAVCVLFFGKKRTPPEEAL
jgi:signal peptidase II